MDRIKVMIKLLKVLPEAIKEWWENLFKIEF